MEKALRRVLSGIAVLLLAPLASGQSMHTTQALIDGAALSVNYPNTFWVQSDASDGGTRQFTGVRLNDWYGITVGHGFFEGGVTYSNHVGGNGSNFLSGPGNTFTFADVWIHPQWGGTIGGSSVDLAIVRFNAPWAGSAVTIGTAAEDELLTYSGFGTPATPSTGFLPADGQRRAFQTYLDDFGSPLFASFYIDGVFRRPGHPEFLALGGVGTPGNSGGGVWNDSGELVGIMAAQSLAPNHSGATYSMYLDPFVPWIDSIISALPGDYDADGSVGQADLNLVLLNWGTTGVPTGWVNEPPAGEIGQAELNGVLLNWGSGAAEPSRVPEPGAALLVLAGLGRARRRRGGSS